MLSYYQIHEKIPFFDLNKYRQLKLIAASNNRVYLYSGNSQLIAVKEMSVQLQHQQEIIQLLLDQYKLQQHNQLHTIQIYGMAQSSYMRMSGKQAITYYICMEYMPYCLADYIDSLRINYKFDIQCVLSFLKSSVILHATLQSKNICHGDIKPQNILINSLDSPQIFKFCDFDNLYKVSKKPNQNCLLSTPQYHAPEINKAINQGQYKFNYNPFKSQVYSLGLCIIQLHPNFNVDDHFNNLEQHFGFNIAQILNGMLIEDNKSRPDFLDLIQQLEVLEILDHKDFQHQFEESPKQLVKSYSAQFISNTPDMFEILRKESKQIKIMESVNTESDILTQKQLSSDHLQELLQQQQQQQQQQQEPQNRRCGCYGLINIYFCQQQQSRGIFIITFTLLLLIGTIVYFSVYFS